MAWRLPVHVPRQQPLCFLKSDLFSLRKEEAVALLWCCASELKFLSRASCEPNLLFRYFHWIKSPVCSGVLVSPFLFSSTQQPQHTSYYLRTFTSRIVLWKWYYPAEIAFTEDRSYLQTLEKETIWDLRYFYDLLHIYFKSVPKNTM